MRDSTVFCRLHYECQLTTTSGATTEAAGIIGLSVGGGIGAVGTALNMSCQYTTAVQATSFGASPNGSAGGGPPQAPLPPPSASPGSSEASLKASGGNSTAVGGNGAGNGGSAGGGQQGSGNNTMTGGQGPPGSSNGAAGGSSASSSSGSAASSSTGGGMLGGPGQHGSGPIGPGPMGFFGSASTPHHPGMAGGLPQAPRQKGRPRKRKPKDIEAMTSNLGEWSLRSRN